MNVKLALILILLFLILLVLFYNINLESNIVILLGIIIILLINDLIKRSEYFVSSIPEGMFINPGNNIDSLQTSHISELDALLHLVQTLNKTKQNDITEQKMNANYPSIIVNNSCIKQSPNTDTPSIISSGGVKEDKSSTGLTDERKSEIIDQIN